MIIVPIAHRSKQREGTKEKSQNQSEPAGQCASGSRPSAAPRRLFNFRNALRRRMTAFCLQSFPSLGEKLAAAEAAERRHLGERKFGDVASSRARARLSNPRGLNLYGTVRNNFQRCLFLDHGLPASRHQLVRPTSVFMRAGVSPRRRPDLLGCASLAGTAAASADRAEPPRFA